MTNKRKKKLDKRSKVSYITIETFKFVQEPYKNWSDENDLIVAGIKKGDRVE